MLTCERKFQLNRLLERENERTINDSFSFGHAFEAGCVSYILNQDKDKAIWETWLAYPDVTSNEDGVVTHVEVPDSVKKTDLVAINMVQTAFPYLDTFLEDWEVASFNGKPASQLSFRVNIDETFYFVGYLDLAIRNKYTGKYAVWDAKTTGLAIHDLSPVYANMLQLIAYSIVLDRVVGEDYSDYDVHYFVGRVGAGNGFQPQILPLSFSKNLKDRLNFFITLGLDVERLSKMRAMGIFPQRGSSCLKYNKPCFHFGTCGLHALDKEKKIEEDTTDYQFVFNLEDLIQDHMERIS
jgi:hypothetical protein